MNKNFDRILAEAQTDWMDVEGVLAVGEGEHSGERCIRVLISTRTPEIDDRIPRTYKGVPVQILESGVISAQ